MSVINSLITLKAIEDQQNRADVNQISNAVDSFLGARQQKIENERADRIEKLQTADILSKIESRKSGSIDELLKGVQLKREGIELKDENLFNIGVAQVNKSLSGGKTSINQYLEPVVAQSMPITTIDNSLLESPSDLKPANTFEELVQQNEESKLRGKQQEADIEVSKQASAQQAKASELAGRDFFRASAAVDTAFDQAISFGERQLDIFGLRPGQFFGIPDKLTPAELNEFKRGLQGAGVESAALIARQLIPGVRAANITRIFQGSTAELGKTMESNANNVAASMRNALSNKIAANVDVELEDGTKGKIQDFIIDPETGKPLAELSAVPGEKGLSDRSRGLNNFVRQFKDALEFDYLIRTFKRNPDLLQQKTINQIMERLGEEGVDQLLSEE